MSTSAVSLGSKIAPSAIAHRTRYMRPVGPFWEESLRHGVLENKSVRLELDMLARRRLL